jgi:bacteriocin-like protein
MEPAILNTISEQELNNVTGGLLGELLGKLTQGGGGGSSGDTGQQQQAAPKPTGGGITEGFIKSFGLGKAFGF